MGAGVDVFSLQKLMEHADFKYYVGILLKLPRIFLRHTGLEVMWTIIGCKQYYLLFSIMI